MKVTPKQSKWSNDSLQLLKMTLGKEYEVLQADADRYQIMKDNDCEGWMFKDNFDVVQDQPKMRVKLNPSEWTSVMLREHNVSLTEWYEVIDITTDCIRIKVPNKTNSCMWKAKFFTTPEPIPTPCPADWQPSPGYSVSDYEAECLTDVGCSNLTISKKYSLWDVSEDHLYVINDKKNEDSYLKFRFATPTLRASAKPKETEQVEQSQPDPVNHPTHYTDGGIETIDLIEAKQLDYYTGNAVKYISRAGKKDPSKEVQDLEKAIWYLKRKVERLKSAQDGQK